MSDTEPDDRPLTAAQREWLTAIRSAESLSDLRRLTGAGSDHEAYLQTKAEWKQLRGNELGEPEPTDGLPGDRVVIDRQPFHVHGVTHADTAAERTFLRGHARRLLEEGGTIYCEQGIRPLYFEDMNAVCEIDDYRWAMRHCRTMGLDSHIEGQIEREFEQTGVGADLQAVASRFRAVTFALIDSGRDVYGDQFAATLGDVASQFLLTHEELATGEDFESFRRTRVAADDPSELPALQQYYRRVFLPQPLEREWLRRHDPELDLFTHARSKRIAAYVLAHAPDTTPVHIVTGAAHQPGITYYLRAHRDGEWDPGTVEVVE